MQDAPRILTCVICHYVFPDSAPSLLATTAEASGHFVEPGATEVFALDETGQKHRPEMSSVGAVDMRKPWVEDSDGGNDDLELIAPWDYAEQTEESNAKADVGSEDLELIAPWDYA